jgi:hypothetical protein
MKPMEKLRSISPGSILLLLLRSKNEKETSASREMPNARGFEIALSPVENPQEEKTVDRGG